MMPYTPRPILKIITLGLLCVFQPAQALVISPELEIFQIKNVGATFQSISLENTYTLPGPVVVCTYNLGSSTDNEAVVRVDDVTTTDFEVRVQRPIDGIADGINNDAAITPGDVFCLVAEETFGTDTHTLVNDNGTNLIFEAHRLDPTMVTNGQNASSSLIEGVEVTATLSGNMYVAPRVLGQVMSYDESNPLFSVFYSYDCEDADNRPFQGGLENGICIGKHIGQQNDNPPQNDRSDEILGWIVVETITGDNSGATYQTGLTSDSIRGIGNSPPFSFGVSETFDFAVATQEAQDGGQGGWAVFYGANPLANNELDLAIEEETDAGDASRRHTTEEVAFWGFGVKDFGDADPLIYGSASHNLAPFQQQRLGVLGGDIEDNSQQDNTATLDDLDGNDDEDGVVFSAPGNGMDDIVASVTAFNTSSTPGRLCAWMDTNLTGGFEASERQCINVPGSFAGSPDFQFGWTVNSSLTQTYVSRFRICQTASECETPTGHATSGEVEDYAITYNPTSITLVDIDLQLTHIDDILETLDLQNLGLKDLSTFVSQWVPDLTSENQDRNSLINALKDYLDPDGDGKVISLRWVTIEERGTIGFYVERKTSAGEWFRIDENLLPGLLSPIGGEYLIFDPKASANNRYQYRLIEKEAAGRENIYGPFTLEVNATSQ